MLTGDCLAGLAEQAHNMHMTPAHEDGSEHTNVADAAAADTAEAPEPPGTCAVRGRTPCARPGRLRRHCLGRGRAKEVAT